VLATRADDRSRLAADFRKSARALLTGPDPPPDKPQEIPLSLHCESFAALHPGPWMSR
jgi:hypothetical protein